MSEPAHATALYTTAHVRLVDEAAIARLGIASLELMQRAASAAFVALRRRWPDARRIAIHAGNGNNGGDAFLLGRLSREAGLDVVAIALGDSSRSTAAPARKAFTDAGGSIRVFESGHDLPSVDLHVDGLFGSGLTRPLEGLPAELVARINASRAPVLALDVPSGLDGDTGCVCGPTVRADATIVFIAWKRGLFTADGADVCGARELATLDIPAAAFDGIDADAHLLDASIADCLAPRAANSNKGNFGHVLVLGGDSGMGGAARIAADAALRVGAGLVSVATRSDHIAAFNAARPEIMAHGVASADDAAALIERASVLAIGPGLGRDRWGSALFEAALAAGKPLVIDADALNLLAQRPRALSVPAVLTPHPGEAARLLGTDTASIQRDRFGAVRELAARYAASVVLKGAGTLVADADGRVRVCPWGNAGMASGGMGDLLTGVIAALLAQGLDATTAAALGVALHARAGDVAAGDAPRGLVASDLLAPLRALANRFGA